LYTALDSGIQIIGTHNIKLIKLFPQIKFIVKIQGSLETSDWIAYRNSQQDYANVCLKVMEDESADYIWVNDYQLMLVPQLLKKTKPQAPVGFYLHSVFPSSEIYRIFPFREELLTGVLAANVIGFHSFQYIRHFQTACTRILGVECSRNTVSASHYASFQYGNSDTKLCAIQKGLDLEAYEQCLKEDETQAKIDELRLTFGHRKVILGVDLLEERKGIPHKFLAFNKFLQTYPEWAHNCVFLQICTQQPHSIDVQAGAHHSELKRIISNLNIKPRGHCIQ
jgi:trehalose-6-phosphate synthase